MKNIELTEEHKSKLLEMCNKLFWNGCINKCDFNELGILFIALDKNYKYNHKILKIHWFEFCMTHLVEKIIATFIVNKDQDRIYKRTLNDDLSKFYLESLNFSRGFNKTHPIDYLYKEFKKLK